MPSEQQIAATMIDAAGSALAGFAAAALCEDSEKGEVTTGSFDLWKAHLQRRLEELSASLVLREPLVLVEEVRWSRAAFDNRGLDSADLRRSLEVLSRTLEEKLPDPARRVAAEYLATATQALEGALPQDPRIDPADEHGRLALQYLERLLDGSRHQATQLILDASDRGVATEDLFEGVLMAAQREVGRLWHRGELSIAEEHFCTAATQQTVTILGHHLRRNGEATEPPKGTVLAATTEGNTHDMPLRFLGELFEIEGWRSILLGASVPADELARAVLDFSADLLLLSATRATDLPVLAATIGTVREVCGADSPRVLVGGRAFLAADGLWRSVGADALAESAREALELRSA